MTRAAIDICDFQDNTGGSRSKLGGQNDGYSWLGKDNDCEVVGILARILLCV